MKFRFFLFNYFILLYIFFKLFWRTNRELVELSSPPPRRIRSRRESSLAGMGREGSATSATDTSNAQGLVIPVGVLSNGNIQAGAARPISDLANLNLGDLMQNSMGAIGAQIQPRFKKKYSNLKAVGILFQFFFKERTIQFS